MEKKKLIKGAIKHKSSIRTLRKFYGGGEPDEDYQILIFGEERPEPEEESEEPNYYDEDYASGGKIKEKVFIEYLNKSKGYKMDRKYFNSYQEAERWARNNFDKFNTDYIRYEYEDGGKINTWFEKPHNLRYISNKSPFHIEVNNYDCAKNIKNKNSQVEIIKLVNERFKQPISYVLIIKNWGSVDELKNILIECSNHITSYGFTSNEQIDEYKKMGSSMAVGGEIEWGEDLGDGFSVGNDVYITDSKSMYQGKTGFVSGLIGKDLLVTILENGNERNIFVSKKGVEKLDAPEFAKGGKVKKDFKVGDEVIYANNGKWFVRNNPNFKNGVITNKEIIGDLKITNYTIKINNGSEIMTSNTKELELDPDVEMADGGQMENSYEKGGELDEEDSLDYNSISDLQTERNRLVRWSNQYGSKGADYKIKLLEERIEYLK